MKFINLITISTLVLTFYHAPGQDSQTDRLENIRRIPSGRAQDSPLELHYQENEDIGILERTDYNRPPPMFTLWTLQSVYATDNAFLTRDNRQESIVWNGAFGVSIIPYSTFRWTPSISYERYLFRHSKAAANDYDSDILSFASHLALNEARSVWWYAGYSLWRFSSVHGSDVEFLKFGEIDNAISISQSLLPELTAFEAIGLAWRHANPGYLDRLNPYVDVGLDYNFASCFHLLPGIRAEGRVYPGGSGLVHNRKDFFLSPRLSLNWTPNKYLGLSASYFWSGNYSSIHEFDYVENQAVLSLSGTLSF